MFGRGIEGFIAGVALIDIRQFDRLSGYLLDRFGGPADLRPLLLIGRSDVQRQHVPERIHGDVDLRSLASLVPVVAGAAAAFAGPTGSCPSLVTISCRTAPW